MGFKFSLKKTSNESVAKEQLQPLPDRRTSLNQANPDWSEKTASLWSDHTNFLEQTKVSGIAPPVRGGTITGLIAAEKQRSQSSRRFATMGMMLIIPLTAGGVFFYLAGAEHGTQEQPSIEEPVVAVAKNPNKNKNKNAAAGTNSQGQPPKADVSDTFVVKEAPYSLGAADSKYKLPNEKALKPIVELSKQPLAQGDWPAADRMQPVFYLTRDELGNVAKAIQKDPGAKHIADKWKTDSRAAVGIGIRVVPQFRFTTAEERKVSGEARNDLRTMNSMMMSLYAWGEQDVAEQIRHNILSWSMAYKPLGDVYSDAELVPLIQAYGNVWYRMTVDERAQVETWLKLIADRQITEAIQRTDRANRWYAYHIHFVTLVAYATTSAQLQNYIKREFPLHLANTFNPDGSTTTLQQTGSMALHLDHMNKLLETTFVHYRAGRASPEIVPLADNSYGRAVAFSSPYATGMKGWTEFEKATDTFIAKRQSQGDVAVATRAFDWRADVSFLETLQFFRLPPNITDVAATFTTVPTRYPTARTLHLESMNRDTKWIQPPVAGPMPASTK